MSHDALARISGAVNNYVSAQVETPTIDETKLTLLSVAGVSITDPKERQRALAARRQAAEQFTADASALNAKLAQAGVESLGTVPRIFWNQLCQEAGLYHLRPDASGQVRINTDYLKVLDVTAKNTAMRRPLIVLLCTTALTVPVSLLAGMDWWTLPITAGAAIGTSLIAHRFHFLEYEMPRGSVLNAIERRQLARLAHLPESTLKELCWPNYVEPSDSSAVVRIELPPPPQDVTERLTKIVSIKVPLSLYVHPEAIAFVDRPETALAGVLAEKQGERIASDEAARARQEAERRARWKAFTADPIVVAECGSAISIIAQYGDFPIEQETVERALAAHPLF